MLVAALSETFNHAAQLENFVISSNMPSLSIAALMVAASALLRSNWARLNVGLVDIAPAPILPWLKGLDDRMISAVEVFGGMLVL